MNIVNGMKYFRNTLSGETEVIRITSSLNPNKIRAKHYNSNKNIFINEEELKSYTRLNPDALLSFCIVKVQDMEDVIVFMYRYKEEISNNDSIPYCVCRQNITDLFTNTITKNTNYGMSISKDTKPVDVNFKNILACDDIESTKNVAVYMDDTLDDILSFIKCKAFDNALYSLRLDYIKYKVKEPYRMYPDKEKEDKKIIDKKIKTLLNSECHLVNGYCKSLRELLEYNNFMYDFHAGFKIFPVNLDFSYIEKGAVSLTPKHAEQLSDLICKNITSTLVLKYSKYIDMDKISKDYILVSDVNENLYIVSYNYTDDYRIPLENVETADNIEKLHNIAKSPNSSVERTLSIIRINDKKYV